MKRVPVGQAMLLVGLACSADCATAGECSTEKVNGDCTLTIDRSYPVAMPTIQMRRGAKMTVVVTNPLGFETLSLDPQSAQAVAGSDQAAVFVTAAIPYLKSFVGLVKETAVPPPPPPPPPRGPELTPAERAAAEKLNADLAKVDADFQDLDAGLTATSSKVDSVLEKATTVYAQLQEILSPIPRPEGPRANGVPPKTPIPWSNADYPQWRAFMLCELAEAKADCPSGPAFNNVLGDVSNLQPALPVTKDNQLTWTDKTFSKSGDFDTLVLKTQTDIKVLPEARQGAYTERLNGLKTRESALSAYGNVLASIAKDFGSYLVNISQVQGSAPGDHNLGNIQDPKCQTKGGCSKLGLQVCFAVNAVNEIFASSLSAAAAKKSLVTITILYADPIFEVSTGVFFSTLPNRSFANQTLVNQSASEPMAGNVVIAQTIVRPTIVPFVGANWRLGHDFLWPDSRRGAAYLTAAIGLNPYNTTAEFAFGPTISWRSLMFSGLFHLGHDVRLTQGEYVGEIWCDQTAASGSIAKCSGSPPSPSTQRYWTGAFAFGIGIRVPSVFGGSGH
jgi:hypothetical protein